MYRRGYYARDFNSGVPIRFVQFVPRCPLYSLIISMVGVARTVRNSHVIVFYAISLVFSKSGVLRTVNGAAPFSYNTKHCSPMHVTHCPWNEGWLISWSVDFAGWFFGVSCQYRAVELKILYRQCTPTKKSHGVMSGDRGGHSTSWPNPMTWLFPNTSFRPSVSLEPTKDSETFSPNVDY